MKLMARFRPKADVRDRRFERPSNTLLGWCQLELDGGQVLRRFTDFLQQWQIQTNRMSNAYSEHVATFMFINQTHYQSLAG